MEKKTLLAESDYYYRVEFRACKDDAWYATRVSLEGETLKVKYFNFPDEYDNAFRASEFGDLEKLQEFGERFRTLSKQAQDSDCRSLAEGVWVCACHCFGDDDLRYYDAVVDGVQHGKHYWKAGKETCFCTFILFWLQGPNAGNLTATTIQDICMVQLERQLDPVVASFLEMARRKIERPAKEKQCANQSVVKFCSPEVSCHDREDRVIEGTKKNMCMILIANIGRELCPSAITEFLHRHTSVSASVFIFPNLASEVYSRGAIMLDSEKEFQKLCDFLNNPNCIVISSTERPWVVLEKLVGLKKIKASIGRFVNTSTNILQKGKSGRSDSLKVVYSGTQEFKIASDMRDLFLEFFNHQERLHKRLALEERRVCN
ncbi:hypothetical protein AAZX31_13G170300 [Glycine max]|nr:hypothetical protein JHK82_036686 [Glycine max]KAH1102204.1 hypothetical protein GYH30_036653 [Glycine max]